MNPKISLPGRKTGLSFSKKIFVTLIALACVSASAFAFGEEAATRAAKSLKKHYSTATDVQWKVTDDYTKASFRWNNQQLEVFYNNEGETIAESRNVNLANLPLPAQKVINEKYSGYALEEAIELTNEENGHNYFVSVSKDGIRKILQITMDGDVSVYRKLR